MVSMRRWLLNVVSLIGKLVASKCGVSDQLECWLLNVVSLIR